MNPSNTCPTCNGTGGINARPIWPSGTLSDQCPACHGTGQTKEPAPQDWVLPVSLCKSCYCMTKTIEGQCGKCGAAKPAPQPTPITLPDGEEVPVKELDVHTDMDKVIGVLHKVAAQPTPEAELKKQWIEPERREIQEAWDADGVNGILALMARELARSNALAVMQAKKEAFTTVEGWFHATRGAKHWPGSEALIDLVDSERIRLTAAISAAEAGDGENSQ